MEKSKEFANLCSDQNMQEWLKEVFQYEDIPAFDETPEFVETLKTIMAGNEAAERDAKAIIKAEKSMKNFYDKKAEKLQLVTDFIPLSSETCQRVESLASLAEKMKLKEPTSVYFLLGMYEIEDRRFVEAENKIVNKHYSSVFQKKVSHTMQMNEKLRRYLKSLTEVVEIQKTHYPDIMNDLIYFQNKKGDSAQIIKMHEESLKEAGFLEEEGIRHSALSERAQKLKDVNEHLLSMENKLKAYCSLQPNLQMTREAVKQREREMANLEEEVQFLLKVYDNL